MYCTGQTHILALQTVAFGLGVSVLLKYQKNVTHVFTVKERESTTVCVLCQTAEWPPNGRGMEYMYLWYRYK